MFFCVFVPYGHYALHGKRFFFRPCHWPNQQGKTFKISLRARLKAIFPCMPNTNHITIHSHSHSHSYSFSFSYSCPLCRGYNFPKMNLKPLTHRTILIVSLVFMFIAGGTVKYIWIPLFKIISRAFWLLWAKTFEWFNWCTDSLFMTSASSAKHKEVVFYSSIFVKKKSQLNSHLDR